MSYDALTDNISDAALRDVERQAREHLRGSAFPQLADTLTAKVCEVLRGMPASSPTDVREAERLVALQLLTRAGRRLPGAQGGAANRRPPIDSKRDALHGSRGPDGVIGQDADYLERIQDAREAEAERIESKGDAA